MVVCKAARHSRDMVAVPSSFSSLSVITPQLNPSPQTSRLRKKQPVLEK